MRLFESVFDELDRIYQKPLAEGWSREENIKKLKDLGYRYNFEKYSDSQIYRILEKTLERDARRAAEQAPEAPKPPICDFCGTRLTDAGYCPKCDDGVEDLEEGVFDEPSGKTNWVAMNSQKAPQAQPAQATQSAPTTLAGPPYIVTIVEANGRLRAVSDDGENGPAYVAFPNKLRNFAGQKYEVQYLSWNGKNYKAGGSIVEI